MFFTIKPTAIIINATQINLGFFKFFLENIFITFYESKCIESSRKGTLNFAVIIINPPCFTKRRTNRPCYVLIGRTY